MGAICGCARFCKTTSPNWAQISGVLGLRRVMRGSLLGYLRFSWEVPLFVAAEAAQTWHSRKS
ncbi:MAG: hypothetical protein KHY83_04340, partial [Coriobacteriia bacterium]|nr:hypothetical protein [Coriobacteriia bacterium]